MAIPPIILSNISEQMLLKVRVHSSTVPHTLVYGLDLVNFFCCAGIAKGLWWFHGVVVASEKVSNRQDPHSPTRDYLRSKIHNIECWYLRVGRGTNENAPVPQMSGIQGGTR